VKKTNKLAGGQLFKQFFGNLLGEAQALKNQIEPR
jgi:hypothetical protein